VPLPTVILKLKNNITNPSLKDVSNAVIAIRQSKLPDPKELGNSGSFLKINTFKN
jgi:UDP-N-acetylmuramate dehydrogenase